jgi:hypothetical protein
MMNVEQSVEWYMAGESKYSALVLFCSLQIPHDLNGARTRTAVVACQRLNSVSYVTVYLRVTTKLTLKPTQLHGLYWKGKKQDYMSNIVMIVVWVYKGYGLVNKFIDHIQVVIINNYNTIADFHTLHFTTR